METLTTDFLIVGGGMVGLSIAHQLLEKDISKKVILIDKEPKLGVHSSGRNSGVIHAGIYYKPGTLKARVSVEGSKRLKEWINRKGLRINSCGKVIVPQKYNLDSQLDLLAERGKRNGAEIEFLDEIQLKELIPEARSSSGRALWSPNTSVVNPLSIVEALQEDLKQKGVLIIHSVKNWSILNDKKSLQISDSQKISFGHLVNCAGLYADKVAHKFGIGFDYSLLPFKGLYWKLKKDCPLNIKTNLYPVPDLNVPFLGVHFTPSADIVPIINIGPTATPAFGRENYKLFQGIETKFSLSNLTILARQYLLNIDGFRKYVHEQSMLIMPHLFLKSAQELLPSLKSSYIEPSDKVGIRAQLFNKKTKSLENDFLCLRAYKSTHVLNSISPAFTASFSLADYIIDNYILYNIKD